MASQKLSGNYISLFAAQTAHAAYHNIGSKAGVISMWVFLFDDKKVNGMNNSHTQQSLISLT